MQARRLGRGVNVVGAGMSPFGSFPEKTSRELFSEAVQAMRATVERGLDPRRIEALYVGCFSSELFEGQGQIAPLLAEWVGLAPRPATRVEAACASGGVALRQGILAITAGLYDVVLVGGVEKMSGLPLPEATGALATAADVLYEIPAGFTFPGFYAAMASAYFARYPADPSLLMDITIKNHENGSHNPKAQLNRSIAQVMQRARQKAAQKGQPEPGWLDERDFLRDEHANPTIAAPLRLFDCSPITDGAAAVLLASDDAAAGLCGSPLRVIGSGQASAGALHSRGSLTSIEAAQAAAREAYEMAGVRPADIQMAEVHDCFTIAEAIALEDLGICPPGSGIRAAGEGFSLRGGPCPVNPSGGLKAKGHPVGASGLGQVVEIWQQMRGEAGARQVARPVSLALAHNVGGTGQSSAVHIFERR